MRNYRLYNILFPVWLFYLLPTGVWLIILAANFLIDSVVLYFGSKYLRIKEYVPLWQRSILRIWGIGFAGDFLGALLILAVELIRNELCPERNTFYFQGATLIAMPGVAIPAVCIYFLDRRYAFVTTDLNELSVINLSRILAVFTAPYAMLIPLYG